MATSILCGALVRPVWRSGPTPVEGPDEDSFTLAVAASGLLRPEIQEAGPGRLESVHLVGAFEDRADQSLEAALGVPRLGVHRHAATPSGLWSALASAGSSAPTSGRTLLLGAEVGAARPGPPGNQRGGHAAGGVAFLLGKGPGLALIGHGVPAGPRAATRDPWHLIPGWIAALPLRLKSPPGHVAFLAEENRRQWQAAWERAAPGAGLSLRGGSPSPFGDGPIVRASSVVWELAMRLPAGRIGIAGAATREEVACVGFRQDGPVQWLGSWAGPGRGLPPPGDRFLDRTVSLDLVAQGAYLPHPRYLENLPARWRLVGERCPRCHHLTFPPRGRCRSCGEGVGLQPEPLPRSGLEVEAVTTISPGAQPTEFDPVVKASGGYDVAVLRIAPDTRATVQVTDAVPGQLRIGDRVTLVLRRLYPIEGEWRYGLKAVPDADAPTSVGPSGPATPRGPRRRGVPPASSRAPTERRATPRRPSARAVKRSRRARGAASRAAPFRSPR
jgi:uncharacterized OB-fold protein